MRTMLRVSFPVEKSNQAIHDGSLPKLMESFRNEIKPEAAYFFADGGKRSALFVFDMKDASQIPVIAESFFMGLNAEVDLRPVMNADDLKAGLATFMKRMS